MGSNRDIAEERLLRVIEGTEEPAPSTFNRKGFSFTFSSLFHFPKRRKNPLNLGGDKLLTVLQAGSTVMWIVLAGLGLYIAGDFAGWKKDMRVSGVLIQPAAQFDAVSADEAAAETVKASDHLKPENFYLNPVDSRNPFTQKRENIAAAEEAVSAGPTPAEMLQNMANGLVVVGINRGDIRDAIIEDSVQKKTYFIKAGSKVKDMTVKEIKYDAVVLTYEGEELEIS